VVGSRRRAAKLRDGLTTDASEATTKKDRPACRRKCGIRFWEQDGSGGALSGEVRSGYPASLYAADVRKRRTAAASPGCALSSHRGARIPALVSVTCARRVLSWEKVSS